MASQLSTFIFKHRILWLVLTMAIFLTADQASKIWVQRNMTQAVPTQNDTIQHYANRTVVVVPDVLRFVYKENPAAAFSLTRSLPDWFRRPFLLIVSSLATLFFLIWFLRLKEADGLLLTSFCLILTGAVGNLADRFRLSYVIDFIEIHAGLFGRPDIYWPTFNIADSCIVAGAIGVILRTMKPTSVGAQKEII